MLCSLKAITFGLKIKTKSDKQESIRRLRRFIQGVPKRLLVSVSLLFFSPPPFKFPSCSGSMHHLHHPGTHFRFFIRCSRCTPSYASHNGTRRCLSRKCFVRRTCLQRSDCVASRSPTPSPWHFCFCIRLRKGSD